MKFYLSHSIRGKYGANATQEQMDANCRKAILIANLIRNALPSIEIYCPAEHEDFVAKAYHHGYVTEKELLSIDCEIIDDCDGVIIYVPTGDQLQGGRMVEYKHAISRDIWVYVFRNVENIILRLANYLLEK